MLIENEYIVRIFYIICQIKSLFPNININSIFQRFLTKGHANCNSKHNWRVQFGAFSYFEPTSRFNRISFMVDLSSLWLIYHSLTKHYGLIMRQNILKTIKSYFFNSHVRVQKTPFQPKIIIMQFAKFTSHLAPSRLG